VVVEQGNEDESKPLLWSERTSLLTKCLTEPTLLEMYENKTQDLAGAGGVFFFSPRSEGRERRHMSHCELLGMILLTATAWGQTHSTPTAVEAAHYPQVRHAEVPLYPPLAWAAKWTGTVEIQVVVESGAVVNAEVTSVVLGPTKEVLTEEGKKKVGLYLSNPALANVKTWQFEQQDRTTFPVRYVYRIEGEPTHIAENPTVELDLPLLVRVTARPLKPLSLLF